MKFESVSYSEIKYESKAESKSKSESKRESESLFKPQSASVSECIKVRGQSIRDIWEYSKIRKDSYVGNSESV